MFLRKAQGRKKDRGMPIREFSVNWRSISGEPSAAWHRLWHKLLAKGKEKPGSTRQDPNDGESTNGSEQIVPNE